MKEVTDQQIRELLRAIGGVKKKKGKPVRVYTKEQYLERLEAKIRKSEVLLAWAREMNRVALENKLARNKRAG
jgi:hypothetical protein